MSNVNNKAGLVKLSNFREALNRIICTASGSTVDAYLLISELVEFISIYIPDTQPTIVSGTPNTLTLDCNNRQQCKFDPLSTISSDFTVALSNATYAEVIHLTAAYTGTRIITFPASFKCSNPSTIGDWTGTVLTLSAGTADIIEMSIMKNGSNYLLIVGEVNV